MTIWSTKSSTWVPPLEVQILLTKETCLNSPWETETANSQPGACAYIFESLIKIGDF